jgi:ribosomal protein L11 methylase PrmA
VQDIIRTGTYYTAIQENKSDFEGKVVMDVGAGSGILSLFAALVRCAVVTAHLSHSHTGAHGYFGD